MSAPPRIVAYEAKTIDGSCSGCPEIEGVVVLKVEPAHGNVSQSLRFCPRCLLMVDASLGRFIRTLR
jgi:hypothetical protein